MSPSLSSHPPAREATRNSPESGCSAETGWQQWFLPGFALACWVLAIRHLSTEWSLNEQYHFGWLVPVLAAYLVKVRFEQCPAPASMPRRTLLAATLWVFAMAAVLVMPIREANLDWRVIDWWLVPLALAASFTCLWQAGGLAWVRHFSFPVLFFLIAVPLPRRWEDPWMQWLMRHNASVAVELLRWTGVDGHARGNLIQLPQCTLGVDEACSGIRSLQGTLMLTLFLGEILGFKWSRRLMLLAAGILAALLTNVGRTVLLGLAADRNGHAALEAWHDPAGFAALAANAVLVIVVAWAIHPRGGGMVPTQPAWSGLYRSLAPRLRAAAVPGAVALAILAAGFGFTEYWFHRQDRAVVVMSPWSFQLPTGKPEFRETEINSLTRKKLYFDEGYSGQWKDEAGRRWQAYYFEWYAGRNATQTQTGHDPRSCLGGVGLTEVAKLPPVKFNRGNVRLSFDGYHFRDGAENVFVFNCLAENVRGPADESQARGDAGISDRIAAAIAGRRQAGQRRLEIAIWDAPDGATAANQFSELINRQIQLGDPSPNP